MPAQQRAKKTAGRDRAGAKPAPSGRSSRMTAAPRKHAGAGSKTAAAAKAGPNIKATNLSREDKQYLNRYAEKLSPSTLRAKWINTPGEHEDKPGQTLATRRREVIEHWAEARGAVPATVSTSRSRGQVRTLRFDFPGFGGKGLEQIGWDDWFKPFEKRRLVFLYQEHMKDGRDSNFFRLDSPEREDA